MTRSAKIRFALAFFFIAVANVALWADALIPFVGGVLLAQLLAWNND